jgi:hypothetical protein
MAFRVSPQDWRGTCFSWLGEMPKRPFPERAKIFPAMKSGKIQPLAWLLFLSVLCSLAAAQRSKKDEDEPTADLTFLILKDDNGKPVRNAAVIMHSVNTHGQQGRGGLELKTDLDGKASFDGIPYGTLRVQVLATGFQTYGEDYNVDHPKMDFTIKLKRPQNQYSIYGDQNNKDDKKDNKTPDSNQKPQ